MSDGPFSESISDVPQNSNLGTETGQQSTTISYDSSTSSDASATVTDAAGNIQSYTFSSVPTIQLAQDGSAATTTGSGPTILIGGFGTTLNGGSGNNLFIDLGNGNTINGGNGSNQAILLGSEGATNVSGTTVFLGAGAGSNIVGDSNTISATDGSYVGAVGNNDTITGTSGSIINIDGNNSTATAGNGGYIGIVAGQDDTANLSDGSIDSLAGVSVNVVGSGDQISAGANSTFNVFNGSGDSISLGADTYLGLSGGGGITVSNDVAGSTVNLINSAAATVNGSGGSIGIFGSDTLAASGEQVTFGGTQPDTVNLYGQGDTVTNDNAGETVNLAGIASATVDGSGGNVGIFGTGTLSASGETIIFGGTQPDTVNLTGQANTVINDNGGETVNLGSNSSAAVDGAGGVVGIFGNDALNASGETVAFGTLNDTLSLTGQNNTVTNDYASEAVNLGSNSSATVDGTGGDVGIFGNDTLAASGETVAFGTLNDTLSLTGQGNTVTNDYASEAVNLGSNSAATVNGTGGDVGIFGNDTVKASGETVAFGTLNDTVNLYGQNDTVTNDYASETVNLAGNSSATINGSGGAIGIFGADGLTASGEQVTFSGNQPDTANLTGQGNTVTLAGPGDYLDAEGGGNVVANGASGDTIVVGNTGSNQDSIRANNDAGIYLNAGADANISGSNDLVVGQTGAGGSIVGTGDTLYEQGANDSLNVENTGGGTDTVNMDATGDYAGLIGGTGYDVNTAGGAGDSIDTVANTTGINFTGGNAVLDLGSGDTLNLNGSGDTVVSEAEVIGSITGTSDTLDEQGANDNLSIKNTGGGTDTINLNATGDYAGLLGGTSYDVSSAGGTGTVVDTWDNTTGITFNGSNAELGLGNGDTLNLNGNGDTVVGGAGLTGGIAGTSDTLDEQGANDSLNVQNTGGGTDTINLDSIGDYAGLLGGANYTVAANGGSGDSIDTLANTTGINFTGSNAEVYLASGDTANLAGSSDAISLNGNDSLGVYGGGGNTISSYGGGDSVAVANTGGNVDTVNGSGVSVYLNPNSQANTGGSGDAITLTGDDSLGAYSGGGNTVTSYGGGDSVAVANTGGDADTVNGSGVNVYLNPNSQANTGGSSDAITLTGNDSLGAYGGGGNTITSYAGGDGVAVANTGGNSDTVSGSGVNVYLNPNAQANVDGNNNAITASSNDATGVFGSNDTLTANGGSASFTGASDTGDLNGTYVAEGLDTSVNIVGASNDINAGSTDFTGVFGNSDVLNASGGSASFTGIGDVGDINGTSVAFGTSTTAVIQGSSDDLNLGLDDRLGVIGNGDVIDAGGNDSTAIEGNNDSYTGSSGFAGITGTGETVDASDQGVSFGAGTTGSIDGSSDTFGFGSGDNFGVTGSSDTSYGSDDTLDFSGSNDSLSGSGDSASGYIGGSGNDPLPDPTDDGDDGIDGGDDGTDPIILNLTGGAVQTQSLSNSTASFDMQNNGQAVQTAWLTAGEGVLVYNPTGGAVTQDSQLVAGFGALSSLAGTSSTTLDASNPLFDQLQVWVDPTGDAQFNSQDLHSLQDLGITSIDLSPQNESAAANGNIILNDSSFTWKGGASGDIAGVELFYNPSSFADTLGASAPATAPDALTAAVNDIAATQAGASFSLLGDTHATAGNTFDPSSLTAPVTITPANALLPVSHAA